MTDEREQQIRERLAELSESWGREKNYSWTITPGQQADIMLLIVKLHDALAAAREENGRLREVVRRLGAGLEALVNDAAALAREATDADR